MNVDMREVRQIFFEESFENLDTMESGLLDLDTGVVDKEQINGIFRAAHSIKGGAGIFKFEQVIHFSHLMETLLDEMRNGEHLITQSLLNSLLFAVDTLRMLLTNLRDEVECNQEQLEDCRQQLLSMLKNASPFMATVEKSTDEDESETLPPQPSSVPTLPPLPPIQTGWHILFKPYLNMLKTGNDPINLFRELADLGNLEIKVDTTHIPFFTEIDPQSCYLSWELILQTEAPRPVIDEIFEWVEGDCELMIQSLSEGIEAVPTVVSETLPTEPDQIKSQVAISSSETSSIPTATVETHSGGNTGSVSNVGNTVTDKLDAIKKAIDETTLTKTAVVEPEVVGSEPVKKNDCCSAVGTNPKPHISSSQPCSKTLSVPKPTADKKAEELDHISEGTTHVLNLHEATSIRVGIDKIDNLINIVGELVITQSMLEQVSENFDTSCLVQLRDGLSQLERNTRELQESVMRIRMLPISYSFNRFPRLVHDLSVQLGKKVELRLSGEHTELDKTVLEKINDPLVHLVRNALDHGIETPEQRRAAGKPETGILHLNAFHQGGNIIIKIIDDGSGFDLERIHAKALEMGLLTPEETPTSDQLYEFVFQAGFSTSLEVSDLSGRGVGMDVVRRNIRSLGGNIDIHSKRGKGTVFTIRLPLTLAILDGQLVRVGGEIYILSLLSIIESLRIQPRYLSMLAGWAEVYKLRDEYIPVLRLYELFNVTSNCTQLDQGLLVIVEGDGQKIGLFVDELLSQQQIVIKSLESNFKFVQGISGATILGDGSVSLILDVPGLIQLFHNRTNTIPRYSSSRSGATL